MKVKIRNKRAHTGFPVVFHVSNKKEAESEISDREKIHKNYYAAGALVSKLAFCKCSDQPTTRG